MKNKAARITGFYAAFQLALTPGAAAADANTLKELVSEPCPCAPQYSQTWEETIRELVGRGQCFKNPVHGKRMAQFVNYPSGSGIVSISAYGKSLDFFDHEMQVMCEKDAPGKIRALGLLVTMQYDVPGFGGESYNFRLSPSGELLSAFLFRGSGKGIAGTGDATTLDIKDARVLERFRHVEDVWLRGMYWRKKNGADKVPAQGPAPR